MIELALHILDIAENSTRAQATFIEITVVEDLREDIFSIQVRDNGTGMDDEMLQKAMDPFYTTKKVRRIGLGLPMLSQAAERAGGRFEIESRIGAGTRVYALFQHSNIDRQPLGDIPGVIGVLILGNPDIDFLYTHVVNGRIYTLDTREIRAELGEVPINHLEVIGAIKDNVREGIAELQTLLSN